MRKKILPETLTVQEKETLNQKQQGIFEMANWLQRQLSQELFEIENMRAEQILQMSTFDFKLAQVKLHFFKHYLQQIKNIKEQIKND